MKYILTIALSLLIFTAASAQTPAAKENTQVTITTAQNTQAPVAAPAEQAPAQDATTGTGPHISANFVGTNDLNLLLLREGIKKA